MVILINATNIKKGGGVQVTDSLCRYLYSFPNHRFVVVLSSAIIEIGPKIKNYPNVRVVYYDIRNNLATLLFGRDSFLDQLVSNESVDCVFTVFGPSRWNPRCPHVSGFARPHLIYPESPFYSQLSARDRIKSVLTNKLVHFYFHRSTHLFVSESEWVSKRVEKCFRHSKCFTITNYYNQVFDSENEWVPLPLPAFEGVTLLNIGANYPHKNLKILIDVAQLLRRQHPEIRFRFVLTLSENEISIPEDLKEFFVLVGKVKIAQCPSLYEQASIMIQPSLLECFSATYPEAMRMGVPIITTDLEFARGLCKDAALYYSPLDPSSAVDQIMLIISNQSVRERIIHNGYLQLKHYDDYGTRAKKTIALCEALSSK